ncbi:Acyl-CoA dehydrogenase/oxidase N-terminal [Trinorchestia longiramus]|nr:Acyl-CoA dehydrogenase/oxidase N-terminal [Trinorchestia longiramus]
MFLVASSCRELAHIGKAYWDVFYLTNCKRPESSRLPALISHRRHSDFCGSVVLLIFDSQGLGTHLFGFVCFRQSRKMAEHTGAWGENQKRWGKGEFWGLSSAYDPDWILTPSQKKLREDLIELCRVKIRPHAIYCDQTYEFPRQSLNAMASLGLLGLIVPRELGGLGETHQCAAMVVETIARYGCPSTAMVYSRCP